MASLQWQQECVVVERVWTPDNMIHATVIKDPTEYIEQHIGKGCTKN